MFFHFFIGVHLFATAGGTRRGNGCARDRGLVPPGHLTRTAFDQNGCYNSGLVPPGQTLSLVSRPTPGADAAGRRSPIPHRSSEISSAIVRRGNGCARDGGMVPPGHLTRTAFDQNGCCNSRVLSQSALRQSHGCIPLPNHEPYTRTQASMMRPLFLFRILVPVRRAGFGVYPTPTHVSRPIPVAAAYRGTSLIRSTPPYYPTVAL